MSANVTAAARAARVERTTPYQARQRDEQFARDWDAALEEALDKIEETAMRLATSGEDPAMTRWVLERRRPSVWGNRTNAEPSGHVAFDRGAGEELRARLKRLAETRQEEKEAEHGRLGKDAGASSGSFDPPCPDGSAPAIGSHAAA